MDNQQDMHITLFFIAPDRLGSERIETVKKDRMV